MTAVVYQVLDVLNAAANALGRWLLAPVAVLPGWLSVTVIALATGVLMLAAFKYTSNQRAIKRVRDDIKADLLTLKLFKDSAAVALRSQGNLLGGAGRLLILSLVPMAVMALPVCLVLGQLALWYQARPLRVGEEAVLTMRLSDGPGTSLPDVALQPTTAAEVVAGPVRVPANREVCWNLRAREPGYHRLVFGVNGTECTKELAVGDGFMRVSPRRPDRTGADPLWYPAEEPFAPDSPVRSIDVDYPDRPSRLSGTDWWLGYWFVVSMVGALCFRRLLNVNI